jgi:hypothetical protein
MGVLASIGLAAAVASAPAPAAAQSVGVVHYPAAFFAPAQPNTALDMINRLPGFTFDDGAQVRGFADAASNVLIDGERRASKEDDAQSILQRIPASQVDHIDLIRGGAPGIDMHGRTVMANVVRKPQNGLTGVAELGTNAFEDGRVTPAVRLEFTRKEDGTTFEGGILANMFVDDGAGNGHRVRTDPDGDVLVQSNLKARAGGFQVNATSAYETPLWGGSFRVNVLGNMQNYKDNEDDHLVAPVGLELLRYRQDVSKAELGLHYQKQLTPKLKLEALAIPKFKRENQPSHFMTATDNQLFDETDTSGEMLARTTLLYTQSPKLSFESALEGDYNIQGSDSTFTDDGVPQVLPAAKVTVTEKRGEAAATVTYKPDPHLTIDAKLRTEASEIGSTGDLVVSNTLVFVKPRLMITWAPDPDDQVRVRIEREVSQLDFSNFVAASSLGTGSSSVKAGNPDLIPQHDWALEYAYERHFDNLVGVLTYRHMFIQDAIDLVPIYSASGIYDAPGNIGSGREDDLDADLTLPLGIFGLKGLQLKGQGTYRHARVTDPTTGVERAITGQHRFDYQLHLTQDLPRWKATWGVDMYNRWTQPNYYSSEIDVYKLKTWISTYVEFKPRPDLALHFEIDNLGGRGFERILYVYNGPRDTSSLAYIDDRRQEFGPYIYFRIRKTLG